MDVADIGNSAAADSIECAVQFVVDGLKKLKWLKVEPVDQIVTLVLV